MAITYLYILESLESDRIRIGMSRDPRHRNIIINQSSSHRAKVAYTIRYETRDEAKAEEKRFHDDMRRAGYHIHRSWYRCPVSIALDILDPRYPRSPWPRGTLFRTPPSCNTVPLPDSSILFKEDLRMILDLQAFFGVK